MNVSRSKLQTLGRIVQEFRVLEPDLPANYAAVIIYVAKSVDAGEDPSIGDISNSLGMVRPSVSRAVMALSTGRQGATRRGDERPAGARKSLGVLERYTDDVDLRMTRVRLSQKGRGLIQRLLDHMGD